MTSQRAAQIGVSAANPNLRRWFAPASRSVRHRQRPSPQRKLGSSDLQAPEALDSSLRWNDGQRTGCARRLARRALNRMSATRAKCLSANGRSGLVHRLVQLASTDAVDNSPPHDRGVTKIFAARTQVNAIRYLKMFSTGWPGVHPQTLWKTSRSHARMPQRHDSRDARFRTSRKHFSSPPAACAWPKLSQHVRTSTPSATWTAFPQAHPQTIHSTCGKPRGTTSPHRSRRHDSRHFASVFRGCDAARA